MGEMLTLLVMGIVQGVADIFPVSSTGHLALLRQVLQSRTINLSLAAGLHSGSLVAITYYFKHDLLMLWRNFIGSLKNIRKSRQFVSLAPEQLLPYRYAVSLLPVAIEGLALQSFAQRSFEQEMVPVLLLILNGIIILVTSVIASGERSINELTWREFFLLGIFQGIAVLPGISRLGVVLCTGLLYRLKWQDALKLTFIQSIPVVIGALLVEGTGIITTLQQHPQLIISFLIATALSGIGSLLSLHFLNSGLLERRKLALFGYYCLMVGSFFSVYLLFWK
jgi:undecaprenyl-diphosphatase